MDDNQERINADEYSLVPINKHNFEKEKKDIKVFSEKVPSEISFTHVEVDGGLFGWGDHKVTGTEMNNFIGNVQNKFIDVNTIIRNIYIGFKDVYEVLDVLDAEYLVGITKNSESAFKASQQALKAQQDITKTVANLKKTVEKLGELKGELKQVGERLSEFQKHVNNVEEKTKKIEEIVSKTNNNQLILKSYVHLKDIDVLWNDLESLKGELREIKKRKEGIKESIRRIEEANSSAHLKYEKKIKTAYYIGGSAICLLIVNYILQIMGIL